MNTERYDYTCAACGSPNVTVSRLKLDVEIPVRDERGRPVYRTVRDKETGGKKEIEVTVKVPAQGLGTWTCGGCGGHKILRVLIKETTAGPRIISEAVKGAVHNL